MIHSGGEICIIPAGLAFLGEVSVEGVAQCASLRIAIQESKLH